MKLLLVNTPFELARNLVDRSRDRDDLQVAICEQGNPLQLKVIDPTGESREPQFVPIHSRRKIDLQAIRKLRQAIQIYKPDIVHAFLPRSLAQTVLACAGMRRKPHIVSFYGITRVPRWYDPANVITYLSPSVAMHACESGAVKQSLLQGGIREERCQVVYNCVAPSDNESQSSRRIELRRQLKIREDAFVVGCVATVRPVKGIDVLMKAAIACCDIPNMEFVIVGQVEDRSVAQLAQHPALQGRLHMLGYIPNASETMPAFDLFAMPSRKEGLCRALLEAMERGVCPIVSDAGGMKEMVRDQVDGRVVPREDVGALEEAIRMLHRETELRHRWAASAQARVRELCSPAIFGDRMLRMYHRLCG